MTEFLIQDESIRKLLLLRELIMNADLPDEILKNITEAIEAAAEAVENAKQGFLNARRATMLEAADIVEDLDVELSRGCDGIGTAAYEAIEQAVSVLRAKAHTCEE